MVMVKKSRVKKHVVQIWLVIQVSQVAVHPDGMLFSGVFDFTDRASRWDAILLRPTNPVGINYR